jgi:hypothetical protein
MIHPQHTLATECDVPRSEWGKTRRAPSPCTAPRMCPPTSARGTWLEGDVRKEDQFHAYTPGQITLIATFLVIQLEVS